MPKFKAIEVNVGKLFQLFRCLNDTETNIWLKVKRSKPLFQMNPVSKYLNWRPGLCKSATWVSVFLFLFTLYSFDVNGQTLSNPVPEADLRAAMIVGILRFTQLNRNNSNANNELNICTLGQAPSVQGIAKSQAPIRIRQQLVRLQPFVANSSHQDCPVVIVGKEVASQLILSLHANTLLICDTCDQAIVEPAVNLIRAENRIQFEVDLNSARAAGVTFSSDLLDLARRVEGL